MWVFSVVGELGRVVVSGFEGVWTGELVYLVSVGG